ncbi:MAG: 3'-5' exonuclease [Bacillales bacterium]|nr:3'-5' exonuclease [Bacillales bacterium]
MNLSSLNPNQYQGVISDSKYIRVIAGAGSGKTRVLTYRIAHLILEKKVYPSSIMAVTFTNKAAKEIKNRVLNLVGDNVGHVFLGTIHAWCARFLRFEAKYINYPNNFSILDEEDQLRIMKEICSTKHGLTKSDPQIKECLEWISRKKTYGLQFKDIANEDYPNQKLRDFKEYFREYDEYLKRTYCLDFDDLLLMTIDILENNPNIKNNYSRRLEHILIDEFQDINDVQFKLITLLLNENTSLYVVGDPDQTIYTWRGANHRLILDFKEELLHCFKNVEVETIVLNQNYRSTKSILDISNSLIKNNKERVKKDLIPFNGQGEKVEFFNARTTKEEAIKLVTTILDLHKKQNVDYKDIAVLYRANYLSREIETALGMYRVPYRVFGGTKFYQRREIKDLIAYFRLLVNPYDDVSFERIINVPKRSIGQVSIDRLRQVCNEMGQPEFIYLKENINNCPLNAKQRASWLNVIVQMNSLEKLIASEERILSKSLEDFVENIGYFNYLKDENDNAEERIENIKELLVAVDQFLSEDESLSFEDFVNNAILQSSQDEVSGGDFVSLMTVHTAKGLEYDYVFVYGMGEGIFPSIKSVSESRLGIEEERRLAYVAFTRAKVRLFVSSNQDYSYVLQQPLTPSRFLIEAGLYKPEDYRDRLFGGEKQFHSSYVAQGFVKKKVNPVTVSQTNGVEKWRVNDRVEHAKYGKGTVVEIIDKLIVIQFDDTSLGKKTFLGNHISIKKI